MKKFLSLLMMALLCVTTAWAETWSYTFKNHDIQDPNGSGGYNTSSSSGGSATFNDVEWTWTAAAYVGWNGGENGKGVQIGSGTYPVLTWQLSTTGFANYSKITSIKVNASTANYAHVDLLVKVGGNTYGVKTLSTTPTDYTFSGTYSGEIQIIMEHTESEKIAMYIKSVEVTYEAATQPAEYNIYRTITAQNPNDQGGWLGSWTNCSSVGDYNSNPTGYEVKAYNGSEVIFTAGPNAGYEILPDNITIKDADNNNVTCTLVSTDGDNKQFKFKMPASNVTISAYFTFDRPTLRLAGRFNGRDQYAWITDDSGPAFTYTYKDENNTVVDHYTLDVYFSNPENLNFFWFRQNGNDLKAANGDETDYGLNENNLNITHSLGGGRNFQIIPGLYTFTINGDRNQLSITRITPTITFKPAAGTVAIGTTVSATSTLTSIINAIKAADTGAEGTVTVQVSTDGNTFSDDVTLNESATVTGKASIGNIVVTATADYTVAEFYSITTSTDAHGTVAAQVDGTTVTSAEAGKTVTLVYSPQSDYQLATVTVTDADNNAVTVTDNTFVMPASNVNVSVTFTKIPHNITVSGECVKCTITGYPETATSGSTVSFTVTPASSNYSITSVTATNTNGNTNQLDLTGPTVNSDGSYTYTFTMQAYDVVLKAVCEKAATGNTFVLVTKQSDIVDGGKYVILSNGKNYIATNWNSGKYFNYGSGTNCFELNGDGDIVTTKSEDVNVFTLEATGSGTFYLKASDGKYYSVASDVTNNKSGQYITVNTDENYLYRVTISSNGSAALNETSNYKLGFNEQTPRFKGYKTLKTSYINNNYQSPIYLYKQQTTTVEDSETLAWIEQFGDEGEAYTVADVLQVVAVATEKKADGTSTEYAFARDFAESINPATCPSNDAEGTDEDDAIDFMRYGKVKEGEENQYAENPQVDPWQQNNWVRLDISGVPEFFNQFSQVTKENPVHIIIKGGRLTGQYTDDENYTIKVTSIVNSDDDPAFENPSKNYTPNVYCPANFHSSNTQQVGSKYYWFMPPKPMEVFELTWALWYDSSENQEYVQGFPAGFYMQTGTADEPGPVGGVGADMSYNNSENVNVVSGASYRFLSVAMPGQAPQPTQPEGVTLRDWNTTPDPINSMYPQAGSELSDDYHIAAVNLDTKNHDQVITGVSEVKSGSDVVSVTYCDLAGRMSQKPFAGVNIIVTRYSDGTVKTTKAIK